MPKVRSNRVEKDLSQSRAGKTLVRSSHRQVNALEKFIQNDYPQGDEIEAMNLLQSHGIISDNCVHASDVAEPDATRAVTFLEQASNPH
jgi:hypothetical protein